MVLLLRKMIFLKDVLTITINISILAIKNSQPLNLNAGLVTEHLKAPAWSWSIIPFLFCLIKVRLLEQAHSDAFENDFCWLKALPVSRLFAGKGLVFFPKTDHITPPHIFPCFDHFSCISWQRNSEARYFGPWSTKLGGTFHQKNDPQWQKTWSRPELRRHGRFFAEKHYLAKICFPSQNTQNLLKDWYLSGKRVLFLFTTLPG